MNMFPGGAEYDDDFDDEDNFVFGTDDIESDDDIPKFHQQTNRLMSHVCEDKPDFKGRGGFGVPPSKSSQVKSKDTKRDHRVLGLDDFRMAVIRGNIDVIKSYIDQGQDPNVVFKCGWTPLMYGANTGDPGLVRYLLSVGANTHVHKDMYTVLMAACASTCVRQEDILTCVNLLLDHGADVNNHDRYHMSPLIYAAREGRVKVIEKLLDKSASINKQDSRGWTALSWAVSKNHKDVVKLLVSRKADIEKKHCDGQTALELAIDQDLQEIIVLLGGDVSPQPFPRVQQNSLVDSSQATPQSNTRENRSSNLLSGGDRQSIVKYGELELFLCGLDLSNFVPLFQAQYVDFETFLRMTDEDLTKMGIHQIGVRKKILDGIQAVHKKEWEKSSLTAIPHNKEISCVHAVAMVSNICKHTKYITSSIGYIGDRVRTNNHILEPQDGVSAKDLQKHCCSLSVNLKSLQTELDRLSLRLNTILSKRDLDPPDMVKKEKLTRSKLNYKRLSTAILLIGTFCVVAYKWESVKHFMTQSLKKTGQTFFYDRGVVNIMLSEARECQI